MEGLYGVAVVVTIFIIICVRGQKIRKLMDDKSNWITADARIIDVKQEWSGKSVSMNSKYRVDAYNVYEGRKINYVKLEYEVNGKKYRKKIDSKKFGGKISGMVRIKYLKGHPTYVRY